MKIKNIEKIDEIKKKELQKIKKQEFKMIILMLLVVVLTFIINVKFFQMPTVLTLKGIILAFCFFCLAIVSSQSEEKKEIDKKYQICLNIQNIILKELNANGKAYFTYKHTNKTFTTNWCINPSTTEIEYDFEQDLLILPLTNV